MENSAEYIKQLEDKIKALEAKKRPALSEEELAKRDEERRAKASEYKARKYREDPEKARAYGLSLYYKKKERNPDFHSKPVGRPRKVQLDTV